MCVYIYIYILFYVFISSPAARTGAASRVVESLGMPAKTNTHIYHIYDIYIYIYMYIICIYIYIYI